MIAEARVMSGAEASTLLTIHHHRTFFAVPMFLRGTDVVGVSGGKVDVVQDNDDGAAVIDGGELESAIFLTEVDAFHFALLHKDEREPSGRSRNGWGMGAIKRD